jgi:hypothetical protein
VSVRVNVELTGLREEDFRILQDTLRDRAGLNQRLAADAESFVKKRGAEISKTEHRTAERLGATPTGHLAEAFQGIEGRVDDVSAMLLIPRASRLRAAFGAYRVLPKTARFLTIPYIAEAYGRRAREFDDLEFSIELVKFSNGSSDYARCLIKKGSSPPVVMFLLASKADIPEDRGLFPFEELAEEARDSAEAYIDEAMERSLRS